MYIISKGGILMKQLSIIIPHFNSPDSLKVLLDSIPKNEEVEVIVIDDKSDKYLELYNQIKMKNEYINVQFYENNELKKGAGVCRNIGIKKATGRWILFADADDYFLIDFYDKIKKYFSRVEDVIYFIPTSIEIDTGKISDRHINYKNLINNYKDNKELSSELFLRYKFTVPWSKLICRKFIIDNHIKFDTTMAANDVMFSTKVAYYMQNFDISEEEIYCVTKNRGSLTTNISEKVFNDRLNVSIEYYKFLKEKLTDKEFNILNLRGREHLVNAFKYKLGMKKVFWTYRVLIKNKIRIMDMQLLNPKFFIKKIMYHYKIQKKESRYMIK